MINNISVDTIHDVLDYCLKVLYLDGPVDSKIMEQIAYCKLYFPKIFSKYEQKILFAMGMFYKTNEPQSLFEKALNIYKQEIKENFGHYYTPDQTLIRKNIANSLFYSFSAPTSSGKSHVFRDLIMEAMKDIVVIVPSRALISEYYLTIVNIVPKNVLVLTFVDNINKAKTDRRIFILTPERATELFKFKGIFDVELILFDEAQITEEKIRGLKFDALVRRTIREFPEAKKVFAHAFIINRDIHFEKHSITENKCANSFMEKTVGQLFYYESNGHYYLYSPYENLRKVAPVLQDDYIFPRIIKENGSVLIYISKSKIYDLRFLQEFRGVINFVPEVTNQEALSLIEELRVYLGASKTNRGKSSLLINLMKKGIVLHHGSIPLKGRLVIETFIKKGYARICFATSTLLRGINMPFDIVYIDNFRNLTSLDFKNLIGRAGRTNSESVFNIGFIICQYKHVKNIMERINEECKLDSTNNLDAPVDTFEDDEKDLVDSIRNNEFNDDLNIPQIQYDRYADSPSTISLVEELLDLLMPNDYPISGEKYSTLSRTNRNRIKDCFKDLYIYGLRNQQLTRAELGVISTSLQILLWKIQGKSFKETVQLRYNYITRREEQRELRKKVRNQEMTKMQYKEELSKLTIRYTQGAFSIPDKHKGQFPLFKTDTLVTECDYDLLVYDTYDYLDKVISLSIADPICAALEIYYKERKELRAKALQNYIKYGTNSNFSIMLLRYGFDFEDHTWLTPCISQISEEGIDFNEQQVQNLTESHYKMIERYL